MARKTARSLMLRLVRDVLYKDPRFRTAQFKKLYREHGVPEGEIELLAWRLAWALNPPVRGAEISLRGRGRMPIASPPGTDQLHAKKLAEFVKQPAAADRIAAKGDPRLQERLRKRRSRKRTK
jgi:hypothetical protein